MCMFHVSYRSVTRKAVSQVLSSQVTNTSNTSSDNAVVLTFRYSTDVSSLMYSIQLYNVTEFCE